MTTKKTKKKTSKKKTKKKTNARRTKGPTIREKKPAAVGGPTAREQIKLKPRSRSLYTPYLERADELTPGGDVIPMKPPEGVPPATFLQRVRCAIDRYPRKIIGKGKAATILKAALTTNESVVLLRERAK